MVYGDPATLQVNNVSIVGPAGPVAIKAIYGTGHQTDPNGYIANRSGVIAIIPVVLQPSTVYTVTLDGSNKGQAFSRAFRFQTSATVYR